MINLAVINLKDLIKYLVGLITTILVVVGLARYFSSIKEQASQIGEKVTSYSFITCLDEAIPAIRFTNHKEVVKDDRPIYEKILAMNLNMTTAMTEKNIVPEENPITVANDPNNEELKEAQTGLETKVVEEKNGANNKYTTKYNGVQIKNESKYNLTEDMLKPDIEVRNKNIMIYHTHTCESYTASPGYEYTATGNYRTTDKNFSVARVGTELERYLKNYGYNVIHDTTYHDYPSYTGSYDRSLKSIQTMLEKTPDTDIIFDVHRDAVGNGDTYGPTVMIGEEAVAQIMFVIGTDGGGLEHPNWEQNLKFAIKVVEKGNQMYPGLFKPIMVRNTRYNQQIAKGASIIEVGATANTLDQCLNSMKYFAKVLNEVI